MTLTHLRLSDPPEPLLYLYDMNPLLYATLGVSCFFILVSFVIRMEAKPVNCICEDNAELSNLDTWPLWLSIYFIEVTEFFLLFFNTMQVMTSGGETTCTNDQPERLIWATFTLQTIQLLILTILDPTHYFWGNLDDDRIMTQVGTIEVIFMVLDIIEFFLMIILVQQCGEPADLMSTIISCILFVLGIASLNNSLFNLWRKKKCSSKSYFNHVRNAVYCRTKTVDIFSSEDFDGVQDELNQTRIHFKIMERRFKDIERQLKNRNEEYRRLETAGNRPLEQYERLKEENEELKQREIDNYTPFYLV